MLSKLQFLCALVVAATYDSWQKLKGIKAAFSVQQQVSEELKQARLAVCEKCPVYFRLLGTCGSALRFEPEMRGCGCWMEMKAGTFCNCWIFDESRGESIAGWPSEINSFQYAPQGQSDLP